MTSWADLRNWAQGPFTQAYGEAKHLQEKAQQAGDDIRSARVGIESVGEVAERLRLILAGFEADADVAESALTLAMRALNEAEESVEQISMEVAATDGRAQSNYLEISDYGHVRIQPWVVESWESIPSADRLPEVYMDHPYQIAEEYRHELQATVDRIMQSAIEARNALAAGVAAAQVGLTRGETIAEAVGSSRADISRSDVEGWGEMTPAQVRANWDALSKDQQDQILARYPELIGNLAGIPFAIRKLANDKNMQAYIDKVNREHPDLEGEIERLKEEMNAPGSVQEERAGITITTDEEEARLAELEYLLASRNAAESLLDGGGAIKFDPENDSVIAISGELIDSPDKIITYVPGTGTDMSSFSGSITDMPEDVIERLADQDRSAVAFTVKDGPWSTWGGEGSNSSPEEMRERGEKVADFQRLVQIEDYGGDPETVAIGHSAGMTKVSAAEMGGMVTDESISLAGSYVYDEWRATPGAEYTHIQYKNDAINAVDIFGKKTPHNQDVFEKTYVQPEVNNNGIDGHSKIAQGDGTNWEGVGAISREIID
ncbi:hypothetical protein [Gulosibacter bifidus]|uniref:Alpha/beta hydrolase n=1 Tax=Gulosibacter bifidus TaxID=272239 RepID=A0ABW5RLF4_9MICO|nr:hypothetical protein [Gulosibacter bifidus]